MTSEKKAPSITTCRFIKLPKRQDIRGSLTAIEAGKDIPFDIKRVYYLYDIPHGASRGSHAHRNLHQLFIAISGRFDLTLRDGLHEKHFHMDRPDQALYVAPMIWRDIDNFSPGAVCLVLASDPYDENDYIRDYADYVSAVKMSKK